MNHPCEVCGTRAAMRRRDGLHVCLFCPDSVAPDVDSQGNLRDAKKLARAISEAERRSRPSYQVRP